MYPTVEQLHTEVYPAVEIVQAEHDRMLVEMDYAEFWAHRSHTAELYKQFQHDEQVTRRRLVRDLTRRQKAIGERILNDLIAQGRLDCLEWRGSD